MDKLDPIVWPAVWQSVNAIDSPGMTPQPRSGARIKRAKNGDWLYSCVCGAMFARAEGELIPETREWIKAHTPHLPVQERE